jgi:hypothetical protein
VSGVLPFIKFYNGSARLSEQLAELRNKRESLYLKHLYQGTIDTFLPTNGNF